MSKKQHLFTRRQVLKYGSYGFCAVAIGAGTSLPLGFSRKAHAHNSVIKLDMVEADVEMVDGIMVPHWLYAVDGEPTVPGPAIFAFENDTIKIKVTDSIGDFGGESRRFAIVGNDNGDEYALVKQTEVPGTLTINPGELAPGTYLYKDPTRDPISRVLGLHGALVILPANTETNPYGDTSTTNVTRLFNELGQGVERDPDALFPGETWLATNDNVDGYPATDSDRHHHEEFIEDPNGPQSEVFERFFYRSRVWLHSTIDPELNRAVIDGGAVPNPATVKDTYLPQYFSINGRQGAFCSHSPDVVPSSTIGEPNLVRMLNAGLANHSPHPHANHIYLTSQNNIVGGGGVAFGNESGDDNVFFVDSVILGPEDRVDVLMPFIRPPDIPQVVGDDGLLVPLDELIPEELDTVLITPQNPLSWPMHSHMELDQTAAGGNYPQGAVTIWVMTGEFGDDFNSTSYSGGHGEGHEKYLGKGHEKGRGKGHYEHNEEAEGKKGKSKK